MLHSTCQSRRSLTRRMALWLVATAVVACALPTLRFIQLEGAEAQPKPGADATARTPNAEGDQGESGAKVTPGGPTPKKAIPREKLRYGGLGFDEWKDVIATDLDPETRRKAYSAFVAFGGNGYPDDAVAVIGAALQVEKHGGVRQSAYRALAKIGAPGVPLLAEALRHSPDFDDRRTAAEGLAEFVGPTRAKMAVPAIPALIEATRDQSAAVRAPACRALGNIVPADPSQRSVELAVAALIERLKEKDKGGGFPPPMAPAPDVRSRAIFALGQIGPKAAAAVPALIEVAQEAVGAGTVSRGRGPAGMSSPENLIVALGQIGPAAKAAVPLLSEMTKHYNDRIALRAREALAKIQAQ